MDALETAVVANLEKMEVCDYNGTSDREIISSLSSQTLYELHSSFLVRFSCKSCSYWSINCNLTHLAQLCCP